MITYCTNIHPGESWAEIFQNLRDFVPQVKQKVSPNDTFPIGLRLSALAAAEIDTLASKDFLDWCQSQDCFIATINAFPYGQFHGSVVKEKVYLPDWRSQERVAYSQSVGRLLDRWLPAGEDGSVSTVPIGFKRQILKSDLPLIRNNLLQVLEDYDRLRQASGRSICLALEPEPGCFLETIDDVCGFFDQLQLPENLRGCLGICFDCCHQAVQFENPKESLYKLAAAGIPVAKFQISSAPRFVSPKMDDLHSFDDACYLHQTVVKNSHGELKRFDDLPDALGQLSAGQPDEWRVHFHIPIFWTETEAVKTTLFFIESLLSQLSGNELLEIETYTWDVLPKNLQMSSVVDSIVREIEWLKEHQNEARRCS